MSETIAGLVAVDARDANKLLTSSSEGGTTERDLDNVVVELAVVLLQGSGTFGGSSEENDGKEIESAELEGEGKDEADITL